MLSSNIRHDFIPPNFPANIIPFPADLASWSEHHQIPNIPNRDDNNTPGPLYITIVGDVGAGKSTAMGDPTFVEYVEYHDGTIVREPSDIWPLRLFYTKIDEFAEFMQGLVIISMIVPIRYYHWKGSFLVSERGWLDTVIFIILGVTLGTITSTFATNAIDFIKRYGGPQPHAVILLLLPPTLAIQRAKKRNRRHEADRLSLAYQKLLQKTTISNYAKRASSVYVVDATQSAIEVRNDIINSINYVRELHGLEAGFYVQNKIVTLAQAIQRGIFAK